jgi:uncharacterized protein (TIGR00251 family)
LSDSWWRVDGDDIVVSVRVTAGARRSEVIEAMSDRLRVRISAPAVEGKANAELQRFLAKLFGVRRSAVSVVRGERARDKTIRIVGVTAPPVDLPGQS